MSKMMTKLRLKAVCSAIPALFLAGCMVGPKYHAPPAIAQAPPAVY
jgi:hypothetical protein